MTISLSASHAFARKWALRQTLALFSGFRPGKTASAHIIDRSMVGHPKAPMSGKSAKSLLVWVAVTLVLVLVHLNLIPYAHDDAYIHMRIAAHMAVNGEPYFNLGEPVKATSST